MEFIAQVVIWSSLIFIIWYYFNKKAVQKEIEERLESEMLTARENLLKLVETEVGSRAVANLRNNVLWTGMPKELIPFIAGKPHNIKESVSMNIRDEKWCYGASQYRYAGLTRYKYSLEIHVQNNIVVGWREN
jgi:hypothetical protein